jgi:LmbE family N-acetylglucosaminyl deacetylase
MITIVVSPRRKDLMRFPKMSRFFVLLAVLLTSACGHQDQAKPDIGECNNSELTDFDDLLIVAPHPDDEILGFAGLASAFVRQGKSVRTIVVTDGDAYCDACTLWTTGSINGSTCDALTLSNLETSVIDSLAETRRAESTMAATVLDRPAPEFLGYPDTGLSAARANVEAGNPTKMLRRSDFSNCASCGECETGYGAGPETHLSAGTLVESLDQVIKGTTRKTLIATTHRLDGHPDHAALGAFVSERAAAVSDGRTVAFAVIHANTRNGYAYADCWYPGPASDECPCFDEERADQDKSWLESLRSHREQPGWPQILPDDVNYGEASQLCLDNAMRLAKPLAINAFETQLGTVGRTPGILLESREGLLDCSGYLRSFGRRTEVFVIKRFPE